MAEYTEKKPLRTLQDLEDYIAKFNRDDFEEYFGYYSKNIRVSAITANGKSFFSAYADLR